MNKTDPKVIISLDDLSRLQAIAHLAAHNSDQMADDIAKNLTGAALEVARALTTTAKSPNQNIMKMATKLRDGVLTRQRAGSVT